ncbi:MAG: RsmE family RNA methyltransferase, partial [Sarcina sp.]
MHKFFTKAELFTDTHAFIQGDDVKHIYKVLRVTKGEKVAINNLCGEEFLGEIEEVNKQEVIVKILEKLETNNESNLEIYLFQGMPKATKMDLIVQKGVELGIRGFIPVITNRVDVKLKGEFKKLDRLNKIALEASK